MFSVGPFNSKAIDASNPPVPVKTFRGAISWKAVRIHSAAAILPWPSTENEQGETFDEKLRALYPVLRYIMSSKSSVGEGHVGKAAEK